MTLPLVALDPENDFAFGELLAELPGSRKLRAEIWTAWSRAGDLRRAEWLEAGAPGSPAPGDPAELNSFGATWELTRQLQADRAVGLARIYFNPCGGDGLELDDAAWAGSYLANVSALRVAHLDLGAELRAATSSSLAAAGVPSISLAESLELGAPGLGLGTGDLGLLRAVSSALLQLPDLDVLVLGAGADGLWSDSRSGLAYTEEGMGAACMLIGQFVAKQGASVLVLGGRSSEEAPLAWLHVVSSLAGSFVFSALDTVPATV